MATSTIKRNTQQSLYISNQTDATIETLLTSLINTLSSYPYDIYMVSGTWKNHSYGYTGTINKAHLSNYNVGYSGTIFDNANGTVYGFLKVESPNHETLKALTTVVLS